MNGQAMERIDYGAPVLCRLGEVRRADPSLANGTAMPRPDWPGKKVTYYKAGEQVEVLPVHGLGERDLQALADGPIMDPLRTYLPAGRLSEREYQQRLDAEFRAAGLSRK